MFPGETILSQGADGLAQHAVDPHISPFQVMHTPAGWYVGTIFTADDCAKCQAETYYVGFQEPNSRETQYFDTEQEAKDVLATFQKTGELAGAREDTANLFENACVEVTTTKGPDAT